MASGYTGLPFAPNACVTQHRQGVASPDQTPVACVRKPEDSLTGDYSLSSVHSSMPSGTYRSTIEASQRRRRPLAVMDHLEPDMPHEKAWAESLGMRALTPDLEPFSSTTVLLDTCECTQSTQSTTGQLPTKVLLADGSFSISLLSIPTVQCGGDRWLQPRRCLPLLHSAAPLPQLASQAEGGPTHPIRRRPLTTWWLTTEWTRAHHWPDSLRGSALGPGQPDSLSALVFFLDRQQVAPRGTEAWVLEAFVWPCTKEVPGLACFHASWHVFARQAGSCL